MSVEQTVNGCVTGWFSQRCHCTDVENYTNSNKLKALISVAVLNLLLLSGAKLFTHSLRPVQSSGKSSSHKNVKVRPHQCRLFITDRNKSTPVVRRPPWFDLMKESNLTSNSSDVQRVYYLTTELPMPGRLGNRMFSYASLFGIAWRNQRRIPIWNYDRLGFRSIFQQLRIDTNHKSPYRNVRLYIDFTTK